MAKKQQQQQIDIKKMSDAEIGALAYDQTKLLNSTRVNIDVLEQELQLRASEKKSTTKEEN